MDLRVRDTQLTGGLGNRLSAGLSEPHRLSLELLRIRLLDFWHDPASPSGIVYPKFSLYSTKVGEAHFHFELSRVDLLLLCHDALLW